MRVTAVGLVATAFLLTLSPATIAQSDGPLSSASTSVVQPSSQSSLSSTGGSGSSVPCKTTDPKFSDGPTTTTSLAAIVSTRSTVLSPTPRDSISAIDAVATCLRIQYIQYTTAADSEYWANASKPFNLRMNFVPAIIVSPKAASQVAAAIRCGAQLPGALLPPGDFPKLKIQARGGGHSYAAYSLGGTNGSMVIDLFPLSEVSVDANGLAIVGGGATLGFMAEQLYNQGGWALPHGTCPSVGIGGHASHGGYGYSSRSWGLTLDTIVALEVVLANSSVITASSESYPEIYYALRGAASSFGIVTAFHFQAQRAPQTVVNFNYYFDLMSPTSSANSAADAFLHIQEVAQNASVIDRRSSWGLYIDATTFQVRGVFNGTTSDAAFKGFERELLRGLPKPTTTNVTNLSWLENFAELAGDADATFSPPASGPPSSHDTFYAKSIAVPESSPLTRSALLRYFAYLQQQGSSNDLGHWFSIPNLYGGPDSQINSQDGTLTAYADRSALWVFQHYSSTGDKPFTPAAYDFVTGMSAALKEEMPDTNFTAYVNYVDPSYPRHTAHKYYYGVEVSKRLQRLKCQVDPNNTFWNPQSFVCEQ